MNEVYGLVESGATASSLQFWGALLFGVVVGWFLYFVNRHRTEEIKLADVATLVAAIGAGAILVLFPAGTDLFGAYGIGLAIGFFVYLFILVLVLRGQRSHGWTFEWFLDGRVPKPLDTQTTSKSHPLGSQSDGPK